MLSVASGANLVHVSCFGGSNGVAWVSPTGGTPPYFYSWSPRGGTNSTATGLSVGTYTVTVTDNNLCMATHSFTVTQPAAIAATMTATDVSCNGANDGVGEVAAASGGAGGFTYSWSNGSTARVVRNLTPGPHSVTVMDLNACTATRNITIAEPPALTSTGSQTEIACNGEEASATIAPAGGTPPYAYGWSNGATTGTATNLAAGEYTATATDARGCTTSRSYGITQPSALQTIASSTDVVCHGDANGSAQIAASGGTPPYAYGWSNGATTATTNGLDPGGYSATVTDAKGCTSAKNVIVSEPAPVVVSTGPQKNVTCHGAGDGTLAVTASGGVGTLKYDWTGTPTGDGTNAVTGLGPGAYTVVVTDDNSCSATRSFTVTEPGVLLANGTSTPLAAVGTCTGSASVAPSGGTLPYSVAWTPGGATTTTASALCGPTAQAIITDANQCTVTYDASIVGPSADLSIAMTGPAAAVHAGSSLSWSIVASTTADAPNAVVSGSVPSRTKFTQLVAPAGWTCTMPAVGATGAFRCTAPSLAAASGATFTLDVMVDELFGAGEIDATVTVEAAVIDGTAANNTATSSTDVRSPARLVATKKVAFLPPRRVTYTIDVRNDGPAAQVDDLASDELVDALPAQLVLKSATATAGAVTSATNTVFWNGALKNGETASITIEAEVRTSVLPETTIANQATVHFDGDGDGVNEGSAGSIPEGAAASGPTTFTTEKAVLPDAGVDSGPSASDGGTNGGPTIDGGGATSDASTIDGRGDDGDSGCSMGGRASSSRDLSWIGGLILGATLALRRRRSIHASR